MTIGERLYNLRKERNISQEELANALDVSRQTVSKWETGESMPDFNKIKPICEYFGITTDELITGSQNIVEQKKEDKRNKFARNLAISVGLYIFSLVCIIVCSASFNQPIIGVGLFFTLIAIATGIIIYSGIVYGKDKEEVETKEQKKKDNVVKQLTDIVGLIGIIVYLLVSFLTGAWHITWIIFIVIGLVNAIVRLIFGLKSNDEEKEEEEENE